MINHENSPDTNLYSAEVKQAIQQAHDRGFSVVHFDDTEYDDTQIFDTVNEQIGHDAPEHFTYSRRSHIRPNIFEKTSRGMPVNVFIARSEAVLRGVRGMRAYEQELYAGDLVVLDAKGGRDNWYALLPRDDQSIVQIDEYRSDRMDYMSQIGFEQLTTMGSSSRRRMRNYEAGESRAARRRFTFARVLSQRLGGVSLRS